MENLKNSILKGNSDEIDNKISRSGDIHDVDNTYDNQTTKSEHRNIDSSDRILHNMESYGQIDNSTVDNFMTSMDKNINNFLKSSDKIFDSDKDKIINSEEDKYFLDNKKNNTHNNDLINEKGNQKMNDITEDEVFSDSVGRPTPRKFGVRNAEAENSAARGDGQAQAEFQSDNTPKKRTNQGAGLDLSHKESERGREKEYHESDSPLVQGAASHEPGRPVSVTPSATRAEPFVFGANAAAAPARAVDVRDDRVLVPSGTGIKDMMEYKTLGQYKNDRPDLSAQALKDDLDQKAVLIKTEAGTYLPKNQVYKTTPVDTSKDKASQTVERDENFKKHMGELGLSDKNFAQINPKTPEFERYLDVPGGGKRLKAFNLEHPEQAGQNSPDILLRDDGVFKAYWLSKDSTLKSPKEIENLGLARENIMLKTAGNSYLPIDTYNARQGNGAAEKQFAKLTETVLNNERPDKDLKAGFYKVHDGVYFSKEKFATEKPEADRSKTEALFQGPSGHSLVTDKTLKFLDPTGAAAKLSAEGLPNGIKSPMNVNKPDVLVRLDSETLISGERAASMAKGKPLDQVFPASDIYLQNVGKNGKPTGNYVDKESFERNNPKGQVYDRLVSTGITEKDPTAAMLSQAFSSVNLGRTLDQAAALNANQPERAPTTANVANAFPAFNVGVAPAQTSALNNNRLDERTNARQGRG